MIGNWGELVCVLGANGGHNEWHQSGKLLDNAQEIGIVGESGEGAGVGQCNVQKSYQKWKQ